jgi:hypothetical protein
MKCEPIKMLQTILGNIMGLAGSLYIEVEQ